MIKDHGSNVQEMVVVGVTLRQFPIWRGLSLGDRHMLANLDSTSGRIHRVVRRQNDWTLKEHEVVVTHWPDVAAIEKRLPHRSRIAIQSFAGKCNLRREIHFWTGSEDALLRKRVREGVPRKLIAAELHMDVDQVQNRMQYVGIRYGKRPPQPTGHRLMDAIMHRAFTLNMSRRDLDAVCGGGQFSRWSPKRKICIRRVKRAVDYLGGELDVHWEPLEN